MRGHAMSPKLRFWHTDVGFNYRLSNLLCAVGVAQVLYIYIHICIQSTDKLTKLQT